MAANDPNRALLAGIAHVLGDLRDDLVFVGGCAAGLLLTDPAAEGVRPTLDVDAIAEVATYGAYHRIEQRLMQRGFQPAADSGVICRWVHPKARGAFDLMPTDPAILGFSNRWYEEALRTATLLSLAPETSIRLISAPCFVATKLEAFISRGKRDIFSHDLEDILVVVDGRAELGSELHAASHEMRCFVGDEISALLQRSDFINALPGLIAESGRVATLIQRLEGFAS